MLRVAAERGWPWRTDRRAFAGGRSRPARSSASPPTEHALSVLERRWARSVPAVAELPSATGSQREINQHRRVRTTVPLVAEGAPSLRRTRGAGATRRSSTCSPGTASSRGRSGRMRRAAGWIWSGPVSIPAGCGPTPRCRAPTPPTSSLSRPVRWFLDRGLNPDVAPYFGRTGLVWAVLHQQVEVAGLLMERGADTALGDEMVPLRRQGPCGHTPRRPARPRDPATRHTAQVPVALSHRYGAGPPATYTAWSPPATSGGARTAG